MRVSVVLLSAIVTTAAALAQAPATPPVPHYPAAIEAQIDNMYEDVRNRVEAELPLVPDGEAVQRAREIGARLNDAVRLATPVRVVVFQSNEISAFAIPASSVYLSTRLLETVSADDALAACIAHQLGHLAARHASRQLTRSQINDPNSLPLVFVDSRAAIPITTAMFSRGFETETDHLALGYLVQAGFDPNALVRFNDMVVGTPEAQVAKVFKTHPMTPERRDTYTKDVAASGWHATGPSAGPGQTSAAANNNGPTLEATMKFIHDGLDGMKITFAVRPANSAMEPYRSSTEIISARADVATCKLTWTEKEGKARTEYELAFANVAGVRVTSENEKRERVYTPDLFGVKLTAAWGKKFPARQRLNVPQLNDPTGALATMNDQQTEESELAIFFTDEQTANRMAKALWHAVELCGGGKKQDPF